jgi:hypothetical protein
MAKCPNCDASWRVRGVEEGQNLRCPFCAFEFRFHPVSGHTAVIERSEVPMEESTGVMETESPNLLGSLSLPAHLRIMLQFLSGASKGREVEITRSRTTLGRGAGDIEVPDNLVSRKHAVVEIYGERYIMVRDLASTNGTFLNGSMVSQAKAQHGDVIRMGGTELRLMVNPRAKA